MIVLMYFSLFTGVMTIIDSNRLQLTLIWLLKFTWLNLCRAKLIQFQFPSIYNYNLVKPPIGLDKQLSIIFFWSPDTWIMWNCVKILIVCAISILKWGNENYFRKRVMGNFTWCVVAAFYTLSIISTGPHSKLL